MLCGRVNCFLQIAKIRHSSNSRFLLDLRAKQRCNRQRIKCSGVLGNGLNCSEQIMNSLLCYFQNR